MGIACWLGDIQELKTQQQQLTEERKAAVAEEKNRAEALLKAEAQSAADKLQTVEEEYEAKLRTMQERHEHRVTEMKAQIDRDLAAARADAAAKAKKSMQLQVDVAYQKYSEELKKRKKVHNKLMEVQGNIQVLCRVRPILPHESSLGDERAKPCFEFPIENDVILEVSFGVVWLFLCCSSCFFVLTLVVAVVTVLL